MDNSKHSVTSREIEIAKDRFPYCIVWTPIPLITALIPCIGHTGICTSDGIIHDFAGPYTVSVDDMAFGNPTKYVQLEASSDGDWDMAVQMGDRKYSREVHNLFCNNCHSHVGYVLNSAGYQNGGWNMIKVWWLVSTKSKYVSKTAIFKTYIGFILLMVVMIILLVIFNRD